MVDEDSLRAWFCDEILSRENALLSFIGRNWRQPADHVDLRQDIYARVLEGAARGLPQSASAFLFTVARNHLINCARRARIVSFELMADLDAVVDATAFGADRALLARDELRRAREGLANLPRRCGDVVRLRKFEGLTTRETAEALGVTVDTVEKQLTLGMRAMTDYMLGGTGKVKRPSAFSAKVRRGAS